MRTAKRRSVHRGQLQISETLIAVSLMLVLALLLINSAERLVQQSEDTSSLDRMATDILTTADEAGILRPVIYLYNDTSFITEYVNYRNLLNDYIATILPVKTGYALLSHVVSNGTMDPNYVVHIGSGSEIGSLAEGGNSVTANYFLSSFASAALGQFRGQFVVRLYLWEKI
ncbi:MAG: hypothetical protein ACFFFG_12205 [Candidatus Thorarchaeota archaeon]